MHQAAWFFLRWHPAGLKNQPLEASFDRAGIETGGVVLKQPASAAEIQPSSTVVLRCHIDGHPR